ncbi:uncharacterized protein LOC135399188 [Ornithodoros turicata]|uniref:uncharacterized protein LOC135399188 n=1 Tax=Ornithodoros turicata TaxID=34597 RepID=UPI003138A6BD
MSGQDKTLGASATSSGGRTDPVEALQTLRISTRYTPRGPEEDPFWRQPAVRQRFGRCIPTLEIVETPIDIEAVKPLGSLLYDFVDSRTTPVMTKTEMEDVVQKLFYIRACHVSRLAKASEINRCCITGLPATIRVPQPINELLGMVANDKGNVDGHWYVVTVPAVADAPWKKWDDALIAKWQLQMGSLSRFCLMDEFSSNCGDGTGYLMHVATKTTGETRSVKKLTRAISLIREAYWAGCLGDVLKPAMAYTAGGYVPIWVQDPRTWLVDRFRHSFT